MTTTSEESEVERLRRHEQIAWDHAVAFKALMHGMQDEIDEKDRTIKRQRAIIAKLEDQLGIDQEL